MSTLKPTIGLEIHAELKTNSKMFCGCKNDPHQEEPNIFICPVCTAHPGTLPVINRSAVMHVLRVGIAVGGTLATFTEFDRKNYFYPDIPKNYQISQYKYPLVSGGSIRGIDLTRIHLEEDTARSSHKDTTSIVDFNRAGVPLLELVTEPVIHDAQTAVAFAKELRLLLKYLGASDANLERGEMRIEANISLAPENGPLGTKVEVKNLNSFKAVEQAIAYEIKRHTELLAQNEPIIQETRGWDEVKQKTFSQRKKESSHDYRYFPEPDLPKIHLDEIPECAPQDIKAALPDLPDLLRAAYAEEGLQTQAIEAIVGTVDIQKFYAGVRSMLKSKEERVLAANYITSDLVGIVSDVGYTGSTISELNHAEFAEIIKLVATNTVSSRGAKDILAVWCEHGGKPEAIAKERGLLQISGKDELSVVLRSVIENNKNAVAEYQAGKEQALQYLVGQGMKESKGAANPNTLREMLIAEIRSLS
jgi:aspartyl-tRNA(Asn)/glutamyl-tRNA(Gln) amidotransferase subunit B